VILGIQPSHAHGNACVPLASSILNIAHAELDLQRLSSGLVNHFRVASETTMVLFETWQPMVISGHPRGHTVRPDPWPSKGEPGTTRRFDTHPRPFGTEKTVPFSASASLRMEAISPRLSRCRFQL
jgi:hypothetical protein